MIIKKIIFHRNIFNETRIILETSIPNYNIHSFAHSRNLELVSMIPYEKDIEFLTKNILPNLDHIDEISWTPNCFISEFSYALNIKNSLHKDQDGILNIKNNVYRIILSKMIKDYKNNFLSENDKIVLFAEIIRFFICWYFKFILGSDDPNFRSLQNLNKNTDKE